MFRYLLKSISFAKHIQHNALVFGSFHDKSPQKKNFFLTTTSLILMKIVVWGYLIAKTHWCKY